ncbi:MAG: SpoIIE family protein phosphatase [Thermoleophilaceae bacterium]|nr:SpoIIE family protein phosphatase [Thermoleophilaceae bacterium]
MQTPHPLRDLARARLGPWVAAMAVFLALAAALLAGGSQGPLASASASGESGASGTPAIEPEPVLGSADLPPAGVPDEPVVEAPVEPVPGIPEPAPDPVGEPVVEEPPAGGDPAGEPPAEQPNEPPVEEPGPEPEVPGDPVEPVDPPAMGEEPPVSEPEPPVEEPAPSEPPVEPGRPLPPPNNAAGGPPAEGTSNPPAVTSPPLTADQQAAVEDLGLSEEPTPETLDREGGAAGQTAQQRTIRFARATGAPLVAVVQGAGDPVQGADPAPAAGASGFTRVGANERGGDGGVRDAAPADDSAPIVTTVRDIVEVVPDELKVALGALAALSLLLGAGYFFAAMRARRLSRQRHDLLQEVGLLQTALLPPVPERLGALRTSVAYRPAEGVGAGGDFYDALPLSGGRVGFILGDVSGHGRGALARTAFMRYTLRAYLEAGLEPRVALQVAGRVIDENLGGDFATVLLAVHDPDTGSLTYATAGHPAPIVVGPQPHDPVTASSSPPIGVGERTGLRQTTVPLVPGSVACLFTDGLIEARTEDGTLGRERLTELLDELGSETSADALIERVAAEARVSADDIAAVVISPTAAATAGLFRTEQLELSARELESPIARNFLESCELPEHEVEAAEKEARAVAQRFGGVVLHVVFGNRRRVEVLPRNVESIESASRRAAAR